MSLLSYFDQFNASLMNKSIHFFKKQSHWSQKLNADCSLLTLLVKFMYGISVETFNSVSSWCLWLCVLGQRSCECLNRSWRRALTSVQDKRPSAGACWWLLRSALDLSTASCWVLRSERLKCAFIFSTISSLTKHIVSKQLHRNHNVNDPQ